MKVLIFIPIYNCEVQVPRVLNRLSKFKDMFHGVIMIDNRSTDKSLETAKKFAAINQFSNLAILQNRKNVSLGGSHKVAFQYFLENDFTHLIVLHGDDQADFSDIQALLSSQTYLNYDCLLGARFHARSKLEGYSKLRIWGNKVLNIACSIVCKKKILDMGSGLNMYSRRFIQDQRYKSFPNDLTFNISLLFHTCFNKYTLHFFPIVWKEQDQISNAKIFHQTFKILWLCIRTFINKEKLYHGTSTSELGYETFYKA